MDPTGMGTTATIGAFLSLLLGFVGWLKYKRSKREKIAQSQADELAESIKRANTGNEPPLTGLHLGDQEPKG